MTRPLLTLAAIALAATSLQANPLPEGEFMLGTHIWHDAWLPRYATVFVEGTRITVELSSPIPLNDQECNTTGDCVYDIIVATAEATGDGANLTLSSVDIAPTPPASVWDDLFPPAAYAEQLLGLIDDAAVSETPDGFALATAVGPVAFLRTDPAARDAIRAYAVVLEVSIVQLAGCEVRGLAPLLAAEDLPPASATFRQALRGFAYSLEVEEQRRAVDPFMADPAHVDQAQARALTTRSMLPTLLAAAQDGPIEPAAVGTIWATFGEPFWQGDRARFDTDVAGFGDTLLPLAQFLRHLVEQNGPITSQAACPDLSFGFIDAQEGG